MKIELDKNKIETSGIVDSYTMGVATDGGFITHFLRDTLYSNKIAAVCREIASNSYDANTENGNGEIPVEITIEENETIISKNISITFKDRGIGMDPTRMKVYCQYAASTKRKTNNQKGGYGLGAKTPFAYTNNYTIETVAKNEDDTKTKYIFQAVLGGDGETEESKILLISEETTTESTGTKITIPIKESDRYTFEYECYYMSHLWNVEPNFYGFKTNKIEKNLVYSGEKFKVFETNKILRDNLVSSVDGIIYPIDTYYVRGLKKIDGPFCVVFEFNTGEVSLNGGRELLKYTDETKNKIEQAFIQFKDEMTEKVMEYYNTAKDYRNASLRAIRLNHYNYFNEYDKYTDANEILYLSFLTHFNKHILNFKPSFYEGKTIYYEKILNGFVVETITTYGHNSILKKEVKKFNYSFLNYSFYELKKGVQKNKKKLLAILEENPKSIIISQKKTNENHHDDCILNDIEESRTFLNDMGITVLDFSEVVPKKIQFEKRYKSENISITARFVRNFNFDRNSFLRAVEKRTVVLNKKEKTFVAGFYESKTFEVFKHIILIGVKDFSTNEIERHFSQFRVKMSFINTYNKIGEICFMFINEKKLKHFEGIKKISSIDTLVDELKNSDKVKTDMEKVIKELYLSNNSLNLTTLESIGKFIQPMEQTINVVLTEIKNESEHTDSFFKRDFINEIFHEKDFIGSLIENTNELKKIIEKYPLINIYAHMNSVDKSSKKGVQLEKALKLFFENELDGK